jgi:hypothetical protein
VDASEVAKRSRALPARFADRLEPNDLEDIRAATSGGEWDEEIDNLLACLHNGGQTITSEERDDLRALLDHIRMTHDRLEALPVLG